MLTPCRRQSLRPSSAIHLPPAFGRLPLAHRQGAPGRPPVPGVYPPPRATSRAPVARAGNVQVPVAGQRRSRSGPRSTACRGRCRSRSRRCAPRAGRPARRSAPRTGRAGTTPARSGGEPTRSATPRAGAPNRPAAVWTPCWALRKPCAASGRWAVGSGQSGCHTTHLTAVDRGCVTASGSATRCVVPRVVAACTSRWAGRPTPPTCRQYRRVSPWVRTTGLGA